VPFDAYVPGDVGYTGRASTGSTTTVSIAAGRRIGLLLFDGVVGQHASVEMSGSTFGTCKIKLIAPDTTELDRTDCTSGASFFDPRPDLPTTGTYTIGIDLGTSTVGGSINLKLDLASDVTGTITIDGPTVTVTTTIVGQDARLTFNATAGQRIFGRVTGVSNPWAWLVLVRPDGTSQTNRMAITNQPGQTFFLDTELLQTSGTYTLWVQHSSTNVGGETFQLSSVPADISGTITMDGPAVPVTTIAAGQDARLTFVNDTVGRRIFVRVTNVTNHSAWVYLVRPDGSAQVRTPIWDQPGWTFILDTQVLDTIGTYTLAVFHSDAYFGSETLRLSSVPADISGTITMDGPAVPVTTTAAGQDARLTFNATAGQRIAVLVTSSNNSARVNLARPDGSIQTWISISNNPGQTFFIDTQVLATTGTYTLWVQHDDVNFGSETLQLKSVPSDSTGPITICATAPQCDAFTVPVTIGIGQNATLTFSTSSSQQVTVHITGNTISGGVTVTLMSGSSILTSRFSGNSSFDLTSQTIPTGSYTILIEHYSYYAGSLNVTLTRP
jgi:hypothetical protein